MRTKACPSQHPGSGRGGATSPLHGTRHRASTSEARISFRATCNNQAMKLNETVDIMQWMRNIENFLVQSTLFVYVATHLDG
jgi:hypothetical protein